MPDRRSYAKEKEEKFRFSYERNGGIAAKKNEVSTPKKRR